MTGRRPPLKGPALRNEAVSTLFGMMMHRAAVKTLDGVVPFPTAMFDVSCTGAWEPTQLRETDHRGRVEGTEHFDSIAPLWDNEGTTGLRTHDIEIVI